jgi:acetyl-CoA carboxylase biotin carboxyl carrier protein
MKLRNINIDELIQLMKKHGLAEIEVKKGRESVKIKIAGLNTPSNQLVGQGEKSQHVGGGSPSEVEKASDAETGILPEKESRKSHYHEIKAPLVGTYYCSPSPDAEPFIEVGDQVKTGDTVCIVEAMKSMNNIESDVSGVVKEICVENTQLVEYGQVLVRIDKKN